MSPPRPAPAAPRPGPPRLPQPQSENVEAWAQTVRVDSPLEAADSTPSPSSDDPREEWATTHRRNEDDTSLTTQDTAQMRARGAVAARPSPAVASADVASASAAVSASLPLSTKAPSDPGLSITASQPSIVVQGKAARSARSDRPGSMETSQTSVPIELTHAPAAVQAAAEQVIAAHQKAGWRPAPPSRSTLPRAPGSREDSSSSHMIAIRNGTIVNGRYKVVSMIGRGGMGTVYQVSHEFTGEQLALKLLHPALAENEDAVGRFRTEARAPVRIDSEHVVRVVDADICRNLGDVPYMVMELLTGHDLRSELKRRGALPAGEVVLYLSQVARALDKAHSAGIVHRDLKPANMYVVRREDGSPLVKVLDFGIAKLTDDAAKELTVAGQVFGTPWYMAPEQARGDLGRVGPGTDLWALGLIAYQLLTGMNYWTADGMAALVGQICYEPMPPPTQRAPHLGPLFDMWFAHACHREPAQRFSSAREMINQLAQALGVNTSATISTDSGQLRHLDSSLQIHTGQPISGPAPALLPGQSLPPGMMTPGQGPIPGTLLAHSMEGTNVPVMLRQPPQVKSNPTAAIALGVIVALVVGGAGLGVWLVSSSDSGSHAGETLSQPDDATPATIAPDDSATDPGGQDEGEGEGEGEGDGGGDGADANESETDQDEADGKAPDDTPAPSSQPTQTKQPTVQPPPQPYTPPPPPPAPKVAPRVGNIDF